MPGFYTEHLRMSFDSFQARLTYSVTIYGKKKHALAKLTDLEKVAHIEKDTSNALE